jgi:hypothetical protein
MRKLIVPVLGILLIFSINAKANSSEIERITNDSTKKIQNAVYVLYPTQNMWTFLKLNTRNGRIWQIQFDVQGNNRFETYLNILPLVRKEKEVNGRFALYPTENIYSFILLDQIDGKTWQVQWSTEPKNRIVVPIE